MTRTRLLEIAKRKIESDGLVNVAKATGISPGHLYHIVYDKDVYPLTKRMEQRLRKVAEKNKKKVSV